MPRRPRIEFEGAIYHVIQRGGPRRAVFGSAADAQAFEACLFEVCARTGWRLQAYALLRDGFHLAVETPRPNLVAGMRALLTTFALRQHRAGREGGRRYARRYRAILVEPGPTLAAVVHFIHLSPARAGLVTPALLPQFRWTSCRRRAEGGRPAGLVCRDWLHEAGGWADTPEGWEAYHGYLGELAADETAQKRLGFGGLERGWAVGSAVWRGIIARRDPVPAQERETEWTRSLEALFAEAGRSRAEAAADPKGAGWKIGVAAHLRRLTTATNAWIARELHMGTGSSVSVYLTRREGIRP